ncbi:hypothetical protein [Methanolobus psychrotolerans]|nr:hypothetical protein [Methanolobus psychrotolerans]
MAGTSNNDSPIARVVQAFVFIAVLMACGYALMNIAKIIGIL